jgi:hypothetical protein
MRDGRGGTPVVDFIGHLAEKYKPERLMEIVYVHKQGVPPICHQPQVD